ncbi:hypothetical protein NEOLEDRAFT_1196163, partial [Neolentinus lepideus HHB14362 ss-1]
ENIKSQKHSADSLVSVLAATKKKYKPVAQKVRTVPATLPKEYRIIRNITGDPLADMPTLSPTPQAFKPTGRYTADRREALHKAHPEGFLTSDKLALLDDFMCKQNEAFAWNDDERGRFKKEFFLPIDFPVLPH